MAADLGRDLDWDGCFNVRDLGGLATVDGARPRRGAIVRADSLAAQTKLAAGEEHYGLIFTSDSTIPRNRASIPLWVKSLEKVLTEYPCG